MGENPASHALIKLAVFDDDIAATAQLFAADPSLVHRAIDSEGNTVLHLAASQRRSKIVEQLLAMDPQLAKAVDSQGRTAFDVAAKSNSWGVIVRFVAEDPSLVSKLDLRGDTILHLAVEYGYTKAVATLLARDPGMVGAVDREGLTPLHWAARSGRNEILTLLLAVASPDVINAVCDGGDAEGMTALNLAARSEHFESVERLLDVSSPGAIIQADREGRTVLYHAALWGKDTLVARLLEMSPDLIDKVTSDGETVLHAGAHNAAVTNMFLALRPRMVHAVDDEGNTILHSAVGSGALPPKELIERLIALTPRALRAVNENGEIPFHVAVRLCLSQPAVEALMVKLSIEEVSHVLEKNYQERYLWPVLEGQCEWLRDVLNEDVLGVVCEFLDLPFFLAHHPHKKQKLG